MLGPRISFFCRDELYADGPKRVLNLIRGGDIRNEIGSVRSAHISVQTARRRGVHEIKSATSDYRFHLLVRAANRGTSGVDHTFPSSGPFTDGRGGYRVSASATVEACCQ
jgi:hypothetical protein